MKPKFHSRHSLGLIVVGCSLAGLCSQTRADNTWDGDGSSPFNWSDNVNWGSDTAPGYGTLVFTGANGTTNTIDANYSMNQVNWNGASTWVLNASGGSVLSLFDNGGTQAKLESLGTGGVTINAPVTFAATAGAVWGEINAVNSSITFGSGGTLTVNGSQVAGIRLFGGTGGIATTFNNTVSASGKYFAMSNVGQTVNIGGAFTAADFYVMNTGTLNLNSSGSLTGNLRLGGDFATTGTQDLTKGGTFALTNASGGQSFSGNINSVASNTSAALLVDSQNTSGTNTLSGSIFLDSPLTFQQAAGGTLAITGVVSNTSSLTKTGTGTLTLSNANTYSGGTIINAGILNISNAAALSTSAGTIKFAGGTLQYGTGITTDYSARFSSAASQSFSVDTNGNNVTFATAISSAGGTFAKLGAGTLITTSSSNAWTGTTTITGGTLQLGNAGTTGALSTSSAIVDNGILSFNRTNAVVQGTDFSGGAITGSGSLVKAGSGTLTLNAANTYTGTTSINAGILSLGSAETAGTSGPLGNSAAANPGSIVFGGGTLQYSASNTNDYSGRFSTAASQAINVDTNGQNVTFATALTSVGGSLSKVGAGSLTLSAANSYTGLTTLGAGTLVLANAAALGGTTQLTFTTASSTTLDIATDGSDTAFATNFGSGTTVTILSNVKTGSVGINHTLGTGLYGGGTVNIQKGANVLSGSPSITLGAVTLSSGSAQTTTFVPTTATLTIASVLGQAANGNIHTLGLDGTSTGNSVTGVIANGNGGTIATNLTKSNTSTWTLSGANTFNGTTTITGGTLQLGNANALQSSVTTISSTNGLAFSTGIGTFNIGALAGASNQSLTDTAGNAGNVNPGTGTGSYTGILSGTGGLIKTGAGNQTLSGYNTFAGNTVVNSGTLTLSSVNSGTGAIRGILTINNGGTVVGTTANAIGYSAGVSVHTININSGGLFSTTATGDQGFATTWNLNGGTMQSNGGTSNSAATSLLVTGGSALVNSWGNTTATVAGRLALRDVLSTFIVQDGTQATDLLLSAATTGAFGFKKGGAGTMVMTGTNTSTNTITVSGGTLQVGNGTAGSLASSPLTFTGSGTFNRQAANAAGAYTQAMGALTFSSGDGTVLSTFGTSTTSIATTFSSLAARTAGATGNFVITGGTATTNTINLTGAALGFQSQGAFFGGSNYLWVNAAGTYARAMVYGSDTGAVTSGATTSVASATHQQITGALSAQATATFTTLKDSGNNNIVLAGGATVTTNGILKTGNTAGGATISGGAGIQAATGAELVIRNDGLNDALTISTPILANGSNALTASGLGTLTLSGANTYTGTTTLNGGVLGGTSGGILNLSGSILAGNVVVNGGTLNVTSTGVINNANAVSQILVGASAGNNSILNIAAGAVVNAGNTASNSIIVGNAAGSNGFIEMTGGTLATAGLFNLGNGTGAGAITPYAAFSMSAGTVTSGSWLVVGAQNDRAVLNQSGGSITVSTNRMTIGAGGNTSIGLVNLSGGTFTSGVGVFVGELGTGILNVSGATAATTGVTLGNVQFAGNASSVAGTVNLLGGTLNTGSVTKGTGTGTYLFNFNGGKLQATAATGATFFANLANTKAYVYSGGGTIDNGGFDNTVAQALLAPAGSGLNSIAVTSGGAGYVDTPIVVLTGGSGVGAQAVANVSGGVVTGFTITNRGSGYASTDVLTATLVGGGWTSAAVAGAIAFTTNVSGAMTFSNSGVPAATTTLSGANTYSGQTTVSGNTTLKLTGSGSLANSTVVLAGGATVATQGGLTLVDGTIASTTAAGLTIGGTAGNSSILGFDAGGTGSDTLSLGSGIFTVNAGGATINITNAGGAFTSGQTLNLLTFGNGTGSFATGSGTTVGALTLANTALGFGVTGILNVTGTQVQLVTSGAATPTAAFWTGLQGTTWASNDGTSGNFYTTKAGTTAIAALPSTVTDITFTATGATNLTNTLGGDFSIKSLVYDSTTGAVVTTGANTLTTGTGGITLESGNGGATLGMTTLALGSAQIWANASANDLAVSANITGGSGNSLTINNTSTGKTVLSGANTYSGATAVNGGILKAGSTGALSASSAYTLADTAGVTLDITGFNNSVGSLAGGGATGGNVTLGAATLTAGANNTSTTYAGVISGTGGFTKAGTGTMILTGTNGYTGATTINAGTLTASGGSAIADASAVSLANVAATTFNLANSETVGSLAGGGTTGGNVTLGANTLTTGGNNGTTTYSGIMSGAGSLSKTGTGAMTLVGLNTFTGNIVIDNGTITAGTGISGNVATSIASNLGDIGTAVSRSITINNSGILSLTGGNVLGTGGSTGTHSGVTLVVNSGGVFQTGLNAAGTGWWNKIGAVNLNGGTIHVGSGANTTNFQGLALIGTVTVGGSTASTIDNFGSSNSASNAIHLGQNTTASQMITFDVADVTGDSVSDLNVSAKLLNTSSSLTASGLIKTGVGTMTLSGASGYTGDTTINGGTLIANLGNNSLNPATSALGNSQTVHNITVNNTGTLTLAQGDTFGSADSVILSTLVINAGGLVTNAGNNFTTLGPVSMNGGTLTTLGGAASGYQSYSFSGNVTVGGSVASTISVTGGNAYNGFHLGTNTTFTVADATGSAAADLTVSAPLIDRNATLGGTGGFTKAGAGTMLLSGASTYTGATTVNAGTLKAGIASVANTSGAFGNNSALTTADVAGAVVDLNDFNTQIGSLAGGGATGGNVTLGSATLTTGANNATTSYAGIISGTGGLIKTGTGVQTLTGINTYSGATTINAGGTLALGSTGSIANSTVITANGTLDVSVQSGVTIGTAQTLKGSGTVNVGTAGNLAIAGTLAAGNSPGVLAVSNGSGGTGSTSFSSGSIFSWDLDTTLSGRGTAYDGVNTSAVSGTDAIFQVVLQGSESFSDAFWTTAHTWSDIFTTNGTTPVSSDLAAVFSTFTYANGGGALGTPSSIGSFTLTGSTLSWSAVPEPTSALAGLLLGAGLLRRRRSHVAGV